MTDYGWITDPHFDHVGGRDPKRADFMVESFLQFVEEEHFSGLFITGDVATSHSLRKYLKLIERTMSCPVYFVLGNHDFWGSSVKKVRSIASDIADDSVNLYYLSNETHYNIQGDPETAILGHDGWYDGLNGLGIASRFFMNDWRTMEDYRLPAASQYAFHDHIMHVSQNLAAEAVSHVERRVQEAVLSDVTKIIILTHIPPWPEAHTHQGIKGSADAQPWYTSKLMGLTLENLAKQHSHVDFTVLCGHTHEKAVHKPAFNLTCHVGGSNDERYTPVYGNPTVTRITL